MIFSVKEEVRATDTSLSTCVRKGTRAIATGDARGSATRPDWVVGHAAARASTGTRRTVHGEKVACVFQARAPENGAATRTERHLRSSDPKGGGETCRHTPKAKPKQRRACREIPGVIRPSKTRCGKPRNFSRETADQRVADWRRERTHESGFRLEMRSIGKAFRSTCDQIERGSLFRDPSRRDRRRFFR